MPVTEPDAAATEQLSFLWLEITGRCQLSCVHCYAASGPTGSHGVMDRADWQRVIDQAADLGAKMVQFIGGEPTLHPDLPDLIAYARDAALEVEVFSNLVHVTDRLWATFVERGVSLACSYYSDDRAEHARITGRSRSYPRTRANIVEALRRSIPLRVGVIELDDAQRADEAVAELEQLGVTFIGRDRLRQVGRGVRDRAAAADQLCGHCADGVLAVSPDGAVWPCVFSRWLPVGNVLSAPLPQILASATVARVRTELRAAAGVGTHHACKPSCGPTCEPCNPRCSPSCQPNCNPAPCQPKCSPGCSPTCHPTACKPRECWPSFQ